MEPQTLKREILQRALTSLLDEAKVPMRQHLKVLQTLQKQLQENANGREEHKDTLKRHTETLKVYDQNNTEHIRQIKDWDKLVKQVLSRDWTGEKGDDGYTPIKGVDYVDGVDGKDADEDRILETILSKIPTPENGKNGRNGFDGEDGKVELKKVTKLIVKMLKDEQLLDLSHIKGAQKFIKDGVSYKIEELMHGGGGSSSSGLNYLALVTGMIDNSNTVFTFAKTPTIVVVNGASYINGFGVTITGTTATLDNAVGTGGSLYALG